MLSNVYFVLTKDILQPYPALLLLMGAALFRLWRRRTEGRAPLRVLTVAYAALVAASVPAVVYPLVGTMEWGYPPAATRPAGAEAIVVLSGGVYEPDRTRLRPELMENSLYRTLHAAELYHQGAPCPVIVTGGVLDPRSTIPPVAPSMRDLLVRLGVRESDVIVEPRARTTFENAVEARKILERRGLRKVVLVTEAVHMFRSLQSFRKVGVDAVPAACHHRATEFKGGETRFYAPSPEALKDLMAVIHEWLGVAWYRARGLI